MANEVGGRAPENVNSPFNIQPLPQPEFHRLSPTDDKIQRYALKILKALAPNYRLLNFTAAKYVLGAPWVIAVKTFSIYFKQEIKIFSGELDRCGEQLRGAVSNGKLSKTQLAS